MFLSKRKSLKSFAVIAATLFSVPAFAEGPPGVNPLNNSLAVLLISIMIILLIVIGILAYILVGAADFRVAKQKTAEKKTSIPQAAAVFIGLMLLSIGSFAQEKVATNVTETVTTIGGLYSSTFYIMVSIIFLELLVILVLLINVRFLLKSERKKLAIEQALQTATVVTVPKRNWWDWFNKLKPIEQEADIDLGHEYDGIRELDNRLPPWWIYGFYVTIIIAAVYLWRYHISHTAPLSREEYEIAVLKANERTLEYLKQKGDAVNENTVIMLGPSDIAEGKIIFQKSCISCHLEGGAGMVGPNLTDDYWLHGGDIKSIFKTIKYGFNAMPTWQTSYSNKQIAQLASYVKSLHGTNPPNAKAPQGDLYKEESPAKTDSTKKSAGQSVVTSQ